MATAAVKTFFSSSEYAVAGASTNPAKFGHKIFMWYIHHNLPVTPINPSSPHIPHTPSSSGSTTPTIPSITALPNPTATSLSVVTPPKATLALLRDAADARVPAVWLQPGTYDDAVLDYARAEGRFAAVVAGEDERSAGDEGWCVLMDGEKGLEEVGKL